MNFSKWYDNADMPTKDEDGNWYDMECGTYFSAYVVKKEKPIRIKSEKTIQREIKRSNKIKDLEEKMSKFDSKNWASYSYEEKKIFYSLKSERDKIKK